MKKIRLILSATFVCLVINVINAQTEQGNFLIGAKSDMNLLFGSSKNEVTNQGQTVSSDGPKTTNFNISPTIGYFFIDGLAGGLYINFEMNNSKDKYTIPVGGTVDLKDNITTITAGPFVRYYFALDKVKPFLEGKVGFGSMKEKYDSYNNNAVTSNDYKYNLFNWGLGAGAAYFITDNISIDAMLGYNQTSSKYKENDNEYKTTMNSFGLNVGFTIFYYPSNKILFNISEKSRYLMFRLFSLIKNRGQGVRFNSFSLISNLILL